MTEDFLKFRIEPHGFWIEIAESCMIRTVSLNLEVQGPKRLAQFFAPVYVITEGDHAWNTLVVDWATAGTINVAPCVEFLKQYAEQFAREYPDLVTFSTQAKASAFSEKVIRKPLSFRGPPYRVPYPGSEP